MNDAWNEYEIKLVGSRKNVKKDQKEIWITQSFLDFINQKHTKHEKMLNNRVMELLNRIVTAIHE